MYVKKCKWCNQEIKVKKQCLFAMHIANCDANPNRIKRNEKCRKLFKGLEKSKRIILKQNCPKCEKEFEIRIKESDYTRDDYKKFCSRKCANGREWTKDHKLRLSNTCKLSEKVKIANKLNAQKQRENKKYRGSGKNNGKEKNSEFVCKHCGKVGYDTNYNYKRQYHKECWLSLSGGIKKGSSRGKSGWYKGYWCDSSYELAFVIYNLEHNISIDRNKKFYLYKWNNKTYKFYPDFRVNGILTEIKNFKSELTDAKLKSVDEEIRIYYKDTIKLYLNYVIKKYGKDYIRLYEGNPYNELTNNCKVCGKPCKKKSIYCSRSCSGKGVKKYIPIV